MLYFHIPFSMLLIKFLFDHPFLETDVNMTMFTFCQNLGRVRLVRNVVF